MVKIWASIAGTNYEVSDAGDVRSLDLVIMIKGLLSSGVGPIRISRDMGISRNITKEISRGKTWKHIL